MSKWNQQRSLWMERDEFPDLSPKIIVQLYKICIDESNSNHYAEFITPITKISYSTHALRNMEQSRTSKLHTTLSMPIDSSLIYARYILKRKLQSHMLLPMYYLSRSVKIHTYRRKIRDWLTRKEIYISTYLFFIFLSILKEFISNLYKILSRLFNYHSILRKYFKYILFHFFII